MKTKKRRTFLKGVPVPLQALILALVSALGLFVVADIIAVVFSIPEENGEWMIYLMHSMFIATGCYFICRQNPKSIWYVPVIANIMVITAACIEPTFWTTTMWIYFGSSFVISIPAGILGSIAGRRL